MGVCDIVCCRLCSLVCMLCDCFYLLLRLLLACYDVLVVAVYVSLGLLHVVLTVAFVWLLCKLWSLLFMLFVL